MKNLSKSYAGAIISVFTDHFFVQFPTIAPLQRSFYLKTWNCVKQKSDCFLNLVYTSTLLTHCAIRVRRIFGARLINFPQTWGKQRTPGSSGSLCVRAKNRQISVRSEWYANHSRMVQCMFAVLSTHKRIWFANCSRVVCEPFDEQVIQGLNHEH